MLLEVEGLTVRYGRQTALEALTLSVDAGEIVGLLGPNGAGKSTALLAIAGAILPAAGRVAVDGGRARVGLADQPPSLYDFFSVEEHLAFVAEARGHAGDPAARRWIDALGLGKVSGKLCRELSFGYRQRVGLAAALVGDTRLLLLDETLNGLDPHSSRRARDVLAAAAGDGAGVVLSTHLLGVAEKLCTRLCVLDRGKLVKDLRGDELERVRGTIDDLYLQWVEE
ncbi:MAG TPA: ABC transporter ATP-binding protein [Haliangiales bacterium]|nr:ABC transporter ATP-binding protein [Haliangiales bacterium]